MLVNLWWKSRFLVKIHFSRTFFYKVLCIKSSRHWKIESKRKDVLYRDFCVLNLGPNLFMSQKWKFAEIHGQKQNSKLSVDLDLQFLVFSLNYSNNYESLELNTVCYWGMTSLETFKSWEYIGKKYTKTSSMCFIHYIVCNSISFSCKSNIHTHTFQKAIYDLSWTSFSEALKIS